MDSPSTSATQSADECETNCHRDSDPDYHQAVSLHSQSPKFSICKSSSGTCVMFSLKGCDFCHKHVFEDINSPFQQCSYITKPDALRCINPAPKAQDDQRSLCIIHVRELEKKKECSLKRKMKQKPLIPKKPDHKTRKKRPSTLAVRDRATTSSRKCTETSSDEEEFTFLNDDVKVDECLWLGNQASGAESTDSEEENPLDHAGVWTVEECVRILRDKMVRLRTLYAQQLKRNNFCMREERRKMLNDFDMDPSALSQVRTANLTGNLVMDYKVDMHLTNYQQLTGSQLLYDKLMKEKRTRAVSLHARKSDLPRCQTITEGLRCFQKVLPFSKYCFTHIISDPEQYLYMACAAPIKSKVKSEIEVIMDYESGERCLNPAEAFLKRNTCREHSALLASASNQAWQNVISTKKSRELKRRRKIELERDMAKPRRLSVRNRDHSVIKDEPSISIQQTAHVLTSDISPSVNAIIENIEGGSSLKNMTKGRPFQNLLTNDLIVSQVNTQNDHFQTKSLPGVFNIKTPMQDRVIVDTTEGEKKIQYKDMFRSKCVISPIHLTALSLTDDLVPEKCLTTRVFPKNGNKPVNDSTPSKPIAYLLTDNDKENPIGLT